MRPSRSFVCSLAITSFLFVVLSPPANAQTWNAASDFSLVANPNGAWRYGWSSTLGGTLTLYTVVEQYSTCPTIMGWHRVPGQDIPDFRYNTSTAQVQCDCCTWEPKDLTFHPGTSGEYSVLRWTAPATAVYYVHASFGGRDPDGASTDVHVLRNGSALFTGTVTGTSGYPVLFNSSALTLTAGDAIDVVVGDGGNDYFNDTTALSVAIISTSTLPAITGWGMITLALSLLGLGSLVVLSRRPVFA